MSQAYSVVIPAYNATHFIAEALHSVFAQTIPPARVIVVDDGSTDDLAACLTTLALPVQLIRQDNSGPGAATTRGIAACDTPLVATLDADDIWLPAKMETQLAALAATPDLSGVFARMEAFHQDNPQRWVDDTKSGWSRSTMLLRRAVFDSVGPMIDPPERRGELIDWIARARHAGHRFDMLPQVLARRRIHPASLTFTRDPAGDRAYLGIAWQAIRRRREQQGE